MDVASELVHYMKEKDENHQHRFIHGPELVFFGVSFFVPLALVGAVLAILLLLFTHAIIGAPLKIMVEFSLVQCCSGISLKDLVWEESKDIKKEVE